MLRRRSLVVGVAFLVVTAGLAFFPAAFPFGRDDAEQGTAPESMNVTVVRVEDGDTLWFRNESGEEVGIRLIGLDAPETRGRNYPEEFPGVPDDDSGVAWLDRWGNRSTELMRERVEGETVRLVFDPTLPQRDFYGRLLAYVYHDGTLLNRQFVERGYGKVYPSAFEKRESFLTAQRAARRADRGLWNYSPRSSGRIGPAVESVRRVRRRPGSTDRTSGTSSVAASAVTVTTRSAVTDGTT